MARIRTIKPEFWRHEDLSELPADTHMLAAALLNYADDEGYFNANPKLVEAECCPLRDRSVSVHDSLNQLVDIDYVKLGTGGDGKRYGCVVKFAEHQRVNRPQASKIKAVGIVWDEAVSVHTQISDDASPERNREQGKEQGRESIDHSNPRDAEFEDWWEHVPRKVGKGQARKAYRTARKKVDAETLLAGIRREAKVVAGKDPQFIRHPTTWLNGEGWLDEHFDIPPHLRRNGNGAEAPVVYRDKRGRKLNADDEKVMHHVDFYRSTGNWPPEWDHNNPYGDRAACERWYDENVGTEAGG